jgi:transcriptional regulator with XRE-family HTH domain
MPDLYDEMRALRLRDAHPVRLIFARNLERLHRTRGPQSTVADFAGVKVRTARALAEKVGCAPAYITQLESGAREPSLTMVARLAEALEVPISALLENRTRAPKAKRKQ